MFIVDFDDTLFDTQGYHQVCCDVLKDLGVTKENYWQAYRDNRVDENGFFILDNERHAAGLAKMGFDEKMVLERLLAVGQHIKDFLFADAHDFLSAIRKTGKPVYLLTWGLPEHQRCNKVEPSGIAHHFHELIYTSEPKKDRLARLLAETGVEKAWFINDKPEETKNLAELFPQLRPIVKASPLFPEAIYQKLKIPYFKTLTEIKDFIFSHEL